MYGRLSAKLSSLRSLIAAAQARPCTSQLWTTPQAARTAATSAEGAPLDTQGQAATSSAVEGLREAIQNEAAAPWTPTEQLRKRKHLTKRMGHLMQVLEQEQMASNDTVKTFPRFAAGDFLEIKTAVPENQRREAIFKGLCIARKWRGWRSTFTVRNFVTGGGGIERVFQLYTPHILSIKVLKSMPTRRAKLYYMRNRQPREYRV